MDEELAIYAEVHLAHFNDDTEERLYLVEYYTLDGALLKREYYKNKQAAYEAAQDINGNK